MDRTVVAGVTGASRGIGFSYVEALLSRGYCVVLFDKSNVESAVDNFRQNFSDERVVGFECDVQDAESFRRSFDSGLNHFQADAYDIFVNNAGIYASMFSDLEKVININLVGAIRGTEMAIKLSTSALHEPAKKPLLVVCTASSNGLVPADSDIAPVYVASKFGLVGFVRSLKPLFKRYNVRVNAICPVTVDTPLLEGMLPPEVREYLDAEGRGGVMPSSSCADALLRIIDDASLAGEVVTVHPAAGPGGRVESLDPSGQFQYLGTWRDESSSEVSAMVDAGIQGVKDGSVPAWSGI